MERVGLPPGAEIGGYTILAPLGAGGMGTVYRAVDGGGTVVALKLLHPHIGADPAARERLRREVAALQRLRHPGVAAILDAEADSTEAFLVTELVPGRDLAEHVRLRGPLDAAGLHQVAERLAGALRAVHDAGVVHRDLKPSNVVLGDAGPVLIDFGVAQSVDETRLTSTGFVVGTPGYLAPELIGGAEPTPATDWWGWAALLTFAATGRAPFGTRPLEAVLARTREGDVDLRGLGPVTAGALWDALAAEPEDRAAPQEVVTALAEAVRRGERLDTGATTVIAAGVAGATAVLGAPASAATLAVPPVTAATTAVPVPGAPGAEVAATLWAGTMPTDDRRVPDGQAVTEAMPATTAPPPVLPPSWSVTDREETTAVWPRDPPTAAIASPGTADPAGYPDPIDSSLRGEGVPPAPPRPPRRWGSLAALGLLALAGAAVRPGITVAVLVPLLLLARTVGSVVAATLRRRERVGVKRSELVRGVAASPWHLLRSLATILPSALIAAALVLIIGGVGWWVLHLDGTAVDTAGSGTPWYAVPALLALTAAVGLIAVWWGPAARTTREGGRWLLGGLAPGRWGAAVLVVLALAVAAALVVALANGTAVDFIPFGEPAIPTAG